MWQMFLMHAHDVPFFMTSGLIGVLMLIFTDFITFKSSLFICNRYNS